MEEKSNKGKILIIDVLEKWSVEFLFKSIKSLNSLQPAWEQNQLNWKIQKVSKKSRETLQIRLKTFNRHWNLYSFCCYQTVHKLVPISKRLLVSVDLSLFKYEQSPEAGKQEEVAAAARRRIVNFSEKLTILSTKQKFTAQKLTPWKNS